jgi:hypothetical protein
MIVGVGIGQVPGADEGRRGAPATLGAGRLFAMREQMHGRARAGAGG